MKIGESIPSTAIQATSGLNAKLEDFQGKWLILYFYPKDSTPGCTTEGQDFRDLYSEFKDLNAEIFGISRDGLKSHENFKSKQNFPFELISDQDENLCNLFEVIKQKNMFGKQVRGIERSTFIISPSGEIAESYRKVKVKGHAAEVLDKLKFLQ